MHGYQGNRSKLLGSDDEKWLATQTLVWEFVTGCRQSTGSFKQTSTDVYKPHFGSNYVNSGAKAVMTRLCNCLPSIAPFRSFMSGSKSGITKELSYNDGVLSDYTFSCSNSKVSVTKSGNKLTISSNTAIDGSARITATRNNVPTVSESAKMIAYGDPNLQDLITGVENVDGVAAFINIETPTGTLTLKRVLRTEWLQALSSPLQARTLKRS